MLVFVVDGNKDEVLHWEWRELFLQPSGKAAVSLYLACLSHKSGQEEGIGNMHTQPLLGCQDLRAKTQAKKAACHLSKERPFTVTRTYEGPHQRARCA